MRSSSERKPRSVLNTVRASRDGHEFHEAWAARKTLQLVLPTDDLVGIAVEGVAPVDQVSASAETVEIADLTFYYGKHATFDSARTVVIAQLKYSIRSKSLPFRASDANKTIRKFAAAYRNQKRKHGTKEVEAKLEFELITNRPIDPKLEEAIRCLAADLPLKGDVRKQANQFKAACRFRKKPLAQFAKKVRITGLAGSLRQNKRDLSRALADWSAAPDATARARLGALRQLLRDKAGSAGEGQNVIRRTDVLDALDVQSSEDLFPCPAAFPRIGKVIKRAQLLMVARLIPRLDKPLLIHAAGGVGKTVFLQSLSKLLSTVHETVLFDCFGGGSYRAPDDARHLPKRGLIHIINTLARDGLCDPLLPANENVEDLIKAFRARLVQAVATLRRASRTKQLLLFIDAVDNAAEHASDRGEKAFPKLLLESFHHNGTVPGVQLIVSCRTHRRDISRGDVPCEEIKLESFNEKETERYLRDRVQGITNTEIQVAYSRSGGNPRILEHLALSDRGLLDPSNLRRAIVLDDLLKGRIQRALAEAIKRGYKEPDITAFLAGLSVLPPPVPLAEYADAHGMDLSVVESFAADLAPLLERTKHGLMFRDEPTETIVRQEYAADTKTLQLLSRNLFDKQGVSVYAASALPALLQQIDDGNLLFDLAFNDRFPSAITSTVGKQNIRYRRLKAAVLHAARKANFDRLVRLLVELSTLAAVNERGADYILDNPDLVVASQDVDATRRLFETRTPWPGTRYARLAIASALAGDLSDAYRHAVRAYEWIDHYYRQKTKPQGREKGSPKSLDIAAIPLCLIAQGHGERAALFMQRWKDWYAYEVSEHLFPLLDRARTTNSIASHNIEKFITADLRIGVLASAVSSLEADAAMCRRLIKELAKRCKQARAVETNQDFEPEAKRRLQDGLAKAVAIALLMQLKVEAKAIASHTRRDRPMLWSYRDHFSSKDVFPFIAYTALVTAIRGNTIHEGALLPQELVDVSEKVGPALSGAAFRDALKAGT